MGCVSSKHIKKDLKKGLLSNNNGDFSFHPPRYFPHFFNLWRPKTRQRPPPPTTAAAVHPPENIAAVHPPENSNEVLEPVGFFFESVQEIFPAKKTRKL